MWSLINVSCNLHTTDVKVSCLVLYLFSRRSSVVRTVHLSSKATAPC